MIVKRRFSFESAHHLPRHPGKCREPHGHSYRLEVSVDRPVDPVSGLAIDFSDLKEIVRREVVDRFDHKDLNAIVENPSAELLAVWIWEKLAGTLPGLVEVELHETESCSVVYRGR